MVSTQMLYMIIAVLVLAVIGLAIPLGIYIQKCTNEGLCMCRGGGWMQNVDRDEQMKKYNAGHTEYSDFGSRSAINMAWADPPYVNKM